MTEKFHDKNRRDFLKQTMAGIAGAAILPSFNTSKPQENVKSENKEKKIIYRTLGRTGIKVPIVSLGCGNIGEPALLLAAIDWGINHFDTAQGYGGGKSENVIGEVLKGRSRDAFVIATRIGLPANNRTGAIPEHIPAAGLRDYFLGALDSCLKRLQTEYVDILYLYAVSNPDVVGDKKITDLLVEIKNQGKARFLGVSFHQNEPAMIRACIAQKIYDVILTSYNFRQPHREEVKQAIAEAAKAGLGIVGMKTMAGVYWDKERKHPINPIAALKWVLQDENVHTTVPGIKTFDQLEQNMSVMANLKLTPKERDELKLGEKMGLNGLYCAQCGHCRSQCRYGLNIPTAMRSYMYAYGYRNPLHAKAILQGVSDENIACKECKTCTVSCTMGFDVRAKMKEINRILQVPDEFLV
jgi:predicted aldo/keto reductase-like oxidoreductase